MAKYIIELKRGETAYKTVDSNGTPLIQLLAPTPYTEPDLDQVRKEAYEKGYERGLNDAWYTMRKIRGMTWNEQRKVFGTDYFTDIIALPASECIEKIRQYEQEKEEQIHVGDEVKSIERGWTAVIVRISDDDSLTLMDSNGAIADDYNRTMFVKTGRHFPEIAEVLAKMKENNDNK